MGRKGLIALAAAAAAWAVVVALIATGVIFGGGGSKHGRAAAAPDCLPRSLSHDAALAGGRVTVSPSPGTGTANPATQISFLGVSAGDIHDVTVSGSRSGRHEGRLAAYSQGDGASFLPTRPFQAGEQVRVAATIGGNGAAGTGSTAGAKGRAAGTGSTAGAKGGAAGTGSTAGAKGGAAGTGSTAGAKGGASTATTTETAAESKGGPRRVSWSFAVATPYSTAGVPPFPNPQASPSEYESFRTLPGAQPPTLTVTSPDRDPAAGDLFTTNGPGRGQYGTLIYTPRGQLVWFRHLTGGLTAEDLNVQTYEGTPALTYWQGKVLSLGYGVGEDIVMNDRYETVASVKGGNGLQADLHEFQLAGNGVAYVTAYNPIACNLSTVEKGPKDGSILDAAVQEIDVKTGLVRWEWHALDHIAVSESETAPPADAPWDWLHLNSIDPQADGDVLISARNTWAGYQIDSRNGRILWQLGGKGSSFHMGPGAQTAWQHDGRILPDGQVTFFDDGSNPPEHSQSRAVRIALSFKAHTARLVSAITHSQPLLAASQGNVQTLSSGNVLVGFGGVPQISQYSAGGTLLFDAHLSYNMIFYRAYRHPWSAQPASPPTAMANLNNTSEETIAHMSWNGATGVASWRVLAGEHADALRAIATAPTTGFESSTILTKRYAYVSVQALSAGGSVLGTSRPVKVEGFAESLRGSAEG